MLVLRRGIVIIIIGAVLALGGIACEKTNDEILKEQQQEGGNVCAKGCMTPTVGCTIKGNVGPGGKFFILPGDPRYKLAIINPGKGERWFCTEQDAQNSGFNPVPD